MSAAVIARTPQNVAGSVLLHIAFMAILIIGNALQPELKKRSTTHIEFEMAPEKKTETVVKNTGSISAGGPSIPRPSLNKAVVKAQALQASMSNMQNMMKGFKPMTAHSISAAGFSMAAKAGQNFQNELTKDLKNKSAQDRSALLRALNSQLSAKGIDVKDLVQSSGGGSGGEASVLSDKDLSAIIKALSGHQSQFRACYERALLKDATLGGSAEMLLSVANGGNVGSTQLQFAGQGGTAGKAALQECLNTATKSLRFPPAASGQTIRFALLLKM